MHALATVQPSGVLPAHEVPVQSLAFNSTGRLFVTGDVNRRLKAWQQSGTFFQADLQSDHPKVRTSERLRAISFSPDGRRMYTACGDTLRAFDLLSRGLVWSFQPRRSFGLLIVSPMTLTVSPSGNVLTVTDAGNVLAFDQDGRKISSWWDNDAPRFVAFQSEGDQLVGVDGFSVCIWEAYTGRKLHKAKFRERIFGMALAPIVGRLAVRTLHTVDILDAHSLEPLDQLPAPAGLPVLAYSPDCRTLALAGREEIVLADTGDGAQAAIPTPGIRVLSLAFNPAGGTLAVGCSDGMVRFWTVP